MSEKFVLEEATGRRRPLRRPFGLSFAPLRSHSGGGGGLFSSGFASFAAAKASRRSVRSVLLKSVVVVPIRIRRVGRSVGWWEHQPDRSIMVAALDELASCW